MKPKKHKRLAFTLLEVMIALALATIIMGILLFFYFQSSQTSILSDKAAAESFKIRSLESRLHEITLRLLPPDRESRVFFSGNPVIGVILPNSDNLVFSYNNGRTLYGVLSGDVLGRLFVDEQKRLTLITWLDREKWKDNSIPAFHREVLLENVDGFKIDFFVGAKTESEQQAASYDELRIPKWLSSWDKNYLELPAILRFTVTSSDKKVVYAFPLANMNAKVIYKT